MSSQLPRAFAAPKDDFDPLTQRCWSCSACQSVLRDRQLVMEQARDGNVVEILGGEKPCLRWAEFQRQKAAVSSE